MQAAKATGITPSFLSLLCDHDSIVRIGREGRSFRLRLRLQRRRPCRTGQLDAQAFRALAYPSCGAL